MFPSSQQPKLYLRSTFLGTERERDIPTHYHRSQGCIEASKVEGACIEVRSYFDDF